MCQLPYEIYYEIFLFLPINDLINIKLCCSYFNNITIMKSFINDYFSKSLFPFEDNKMVEENIKLYTNRNILNPILETLDHYYWNKKTGVFEDLSDGMLITNDHEFKYTINGKFLQIGTGSLCIDMDKWKECTFITKKDISNKFSYITFTI